jgi:hypothetical protein
VAGSYRDLAQASASTTRQSSKHCGRDTLYCWLHRKPLAEQWPFHPAEGPKPLFFSFKIRRQWLTMQSANTLITIPETA